MDKHTTLSIGHKMSFTHTDDHQKLRIYASIASVTIATILVLMKLYAYVETGSMTVLSALIDSSVDLMTSSIIFIGIRKALKPADQYHRYGHGKAESLVALVQASFIVGSCVILLYEVVNNLLHPKEMQAPEVGIIVMVIAVILTLCLLLFQNYVIKHTNSVAIKADRLHYRGDLFMNFSVVIVLIISGESGIWYLDPLFAIGVATFLIIGTKSLVKDALNILMDHELSPDERTQIKNIVMSHPSAKGLHDLRSRYDGMYRFIEFHLELSPDLTLWQAHEITDEIEQRLRAHFVHAEILIHQEPEGLDDDRLDHKLG
jgi:ferrous-iron efflux pump FieF